MDLILMATKYREHYNAALNTLDEKKKQIIKQITSNKAVQHWDTTWYNKFIKEVAAKAEAAYEAEITKQTKTEPNKTEIKPNKG